MSMDISFRVLGFAVVMCGLGSLMECNARKAKRERRLTRIPREAANSALG
jgi:hypothetical protein